MTDGLTLHLDRVTKTLDRFFPDEAARACLETGADSTRALVEQRYQSLTEAQKFWLPHDLPLDTALLFIRQDSAAWQQAHRAALKDYSEFAQRAGWTALGTKTPSMGAEPAASAPTATVAGEKIVDSRATTFAAVLDKYYGSHYNDELYRFGIINGLKKFLEDKKTPYKAKKKLLELLLKYPSGTDIDDIVFALRTDIEEYEIDQALKALIDA